MSTKFVLRLLYLCGIIIFGINTVSQSFAQEEKPVYLPLTMHRSRIEKTGKIAFTSYRDGVNGDIYTMNHDGSNVNQLTHDPAEDHSPVWSPDGSKIAFVSNRTGDSEIYVMNADGNDQTRLTTLNRSYQPRWSPDGTRIVFYSRQDNNNIVYTMNPDGSGLFPVTDPQMSADNPYWLPDGSKIAFSSTRSIPGIYTIYPDGTNQTLLLETNLMGWFAISPDGRRIAISKGSESSFNFDLYIYSITTEKLERITHTQYNHNSVDWSPDGNFLVFHSNRDDISNFEIYTMNIFGSDITNLTQHADADSLPNWTR
jgi:Tol biopolymer transport system component